jgi:hypothetical protein
MKLGVTDLSGIVRQMTGEVPKLGFNVFRRYTASIEADGLPFKGCGASPVSALLDLIRDLAVDERNKIERANGCATEDDD